MIRASTKSQPIPEDKTKLLLYAIDKSKLDILSLLLSDHMWREFFLHFHKKEADEISKEEKDPSQKQDEDKSKDED